MKKYVFIIALLQCHFPSVQASIINGFLQEKLILEKKIKNVVELLNEDNTDKATRQIEKKLKKLRKEYAKVITKYSDTEQLLVSIEFIDPDLYELVSNVTNADGTLTHVYVRYVNRLSDEFTYFTDNYFWAKAYTSGRQSEINSNVCTSLYGTNTITVTVGIGCDEKMVLCHEFAHVLFVVPNINEYSVFLKSQNKFIKNYFSRGHSPLDPSATLSESVENSFSAKYKAYLKKVNDKDAFKQNLASRKDNNSIPVGVED